MEKNNFIGGWSADFSFPVQEFGCSWTCSVKLTVRESLGGGNSIGNFLCVLLKCLRKVPHTCIFACPACGTGTDAVNLQCPFNEAYKGNSYARESFHPFGGP